MSEDLEDPIDHRIRLQKHLEGLEVFMAGPAYAGYVNARTAELAEINERILYLDPVSREDEIEQFKLRGERRLLQDLTQTFEVVRDTLKAEIEKLLDAEKENTTRKQ